MKSEKVLEICCESVSSALIAEAGGADRIELCSNLAQGGITPSIGAIKTAKSLLNIPVCVLIRPRKGDFLYNDAEFNVMLEDIRAAKDAGADGIVSGALTSEGYIDMCKLAQMVKAAEPLPFTFHRAFDMCVNPIEAIDLLIDAGIKRLLTSGARPTAVEGKMNIKKYIIQTAYCFEIIACGDLRPENFEEILRIKYLNEYHSAALRKVNSRMTHRGATNMGDEPVEQEFSWYETDEKMVREMKTMMKG